MGPLLLFLLGLTLVLAIIAIVGHGIWVLMEHITGVKSPAARSQNNCPHCSCVLISGRHDCPVCGWPQFHAQAYDRTEASLQALARQAIRCHQMQLIDYEVLQRVLAGLKRESEQLRQPEVPPSPQPGVAATQRDVAQEARHAAKPPVTAKPAEPSEPIVTAEPVLPLTPQERVAAYSESRRETLEEASSPEATVDRQPHKTPVAKLLASFMEERNIRWGELVGGLLIVCCSVALVISFWSQIADRPLLKFGVFNGVTAALFGIGFYTHRRWKLATTSHGVLIIGTLLVPLNFLAIAAFTEAPGAANALMIAGEVGSLAVFSVLVYLASRILTPKCALTTTLGVMLASLLELLTRRYAAPGVMPTTLLYIAAAPIAIYLSTTCVMLARIQGSGKAKAEVDEATAHAALKFLGLVSFATVLPLALMCHKYGDLIGALRHTAPALGAFGVPALLTGLWLWREVKSPDLAGLRTTSTAVGLVGAALMITAMCLAWPHVGKLAGAALIDTIILVVLGRIFAFPFALLPAAACAMIGWLLAAQVWQGNLTWATSSGVDIATAVLSATGGTSLLPFAALLAAVCGVWLKFKRPEELRYTTIALGIAVVASLVLVTGFGFARHGDPERITWVYLVYGLIAMAGTVITRRAPLAITSSLLMLAAALQGVVFGGMNLPALSQPWATALLVHATWQTLFAGFLKWMRAPAGTDDVAVRLLFDATLLSSGLVIAILVFSLPFASAITLSLLTGWLALIWLHTGSASQHRPWILGCQIMTVASLMLWVVSAVERTSWFAESHLPLLEPLFLQRAGLTLAGYALLWSLLSLWTRSTTWMEGDSNVDDEATTSYWLPRQLMWSFARIESALICACVAAIVFLGIVAAAPGVQQELSPRPSPPTGEVSARIVPSLESLQVLDLPHADAAQGWGWLLIGMALTVVLLRMKRVDARWHLPVAILLLFTTCPLLAVHWHQDVAVASALRWILATAFLLGCIAVWNRKAFTALMPWLSRVKHATTDVAAEGPPLPQRERSVADARVTLLLLSIAPLVAMAVYIVAAAVSRIDLKVELGDLPGMIVGWFILALMLTVLLRGVSTEWNRMARHASGVTLFLGIAPVVVVTMYVVAIALKRHPLVMPNPDSWFATSGLAISYAIPIVLMAVGLVGTAIRERLARYAFAGTLLFNLAATAALLLSLTRLGMSLDVVTWIRTAQLNGIVTSVGCLAWLALFYYERRRSELEFPSLLVTQVGFAIALCLITVAPATIMVAIQPWDVSIAAEAAHWMGWLAVGLGVLAVVISQRRVASPSVPAVLPWLMIFVSAMISLTVSRWDGGNWLAYHWLLVLCCATAGAQFLVMHLLPAWRENTERRSVGWPTSLGIACLALSVRTLFGDPQAPWWAIGGLLWSALLATALSCSSLRRRYLYVAALLINLAASLWWLDTGIRWTNSFGLALIVDFLHLNAIALALPCLAWLAIERRIQRGPGVVPVATGCHRVASTISLGLYLVAVSICLAGDAIGANLNGSLVLNSLALVAVAIAVLACLWDPATRHVTANLYTLGVAAIASVLAWLDLHDAELWCYGTVFAGAFALLSSYLWSRRSGIVQLGKRLGVPARSWRVAAANEEENLVGLGWLVPANCVVACLVMCSAFFIQLSNNEFVMRASAAQTALAQALTIGLLARGTRQTELRTTSLLFGVLGAVALGWVGLAPGISSPVLNRAVVTTVVLAIMIVVYGLGIAKVFRRDEWPAAAQQLVPALVLAVFGAQVLAICMELNQYLMKGQVEIQWPALLASAIAWIGLALAALVAALVPGRDPLNLSVRGRTAYVYGAEALVALLLLHLRLTMPWLFEGFFVAYWPFIVMALAFLGAAFAELFRRRQQLVLSEPFEVTGVLLPLLPVIGFWIMPAEGVHYSQLLLSVGALYALVAVMRKSFVFAMIAALAGNASLWYLLHQTGSLRFDQHPQLWLIPPALCTLVAAYLNQRQLRESQLTAIRYASATVIYASSTVEIFINGIATAPWLPLVLGGLSIAGVMAGIWLRVRAFLYLGASFLLVSLLTIIWHAAVDLEQTWVWSVSGIVAGILIITVFAIFEKKRDKVLHLVEELRDWHA